MATALLVSITYTWNHSDALAMIMGVYVVGVFSGAVSAILINIPGAPSSVVTTWMVILCLRRDSLIRRFLRLQSILSWVVFWIYCFGTVG